MKIRAQRKIKIIVACLLLLYAMEAPAQANALSPVQTLYLRLPVERLANFAGHFSPLPSPKEQTDPLLQSGFKVNALRVRTIPGNYYLGQLGFICKKEWQFEKTTHLPLTIRLGSLQYCNFLEGKDNHRQ